MGSVEYLSRAFGPAFSSAAWNLQEGQEATGKALAPNGGCASGPPEKEVTQEERRRRVRRQRDFKWSNGVGDGAGAARRVGVVGDGSAILCSMAKVNWIF